uniref:HECT-type E3 ubiquitin transferase n=1 Tax=Heliothis virescens TaxID=7102 RepID=A0A2A4K2U1_HELVI
MWQFEDSEIYSIGMIHPSHSRHSGLSMLSGVSQFSGISTLSGCGSPDQLDRLPELPAAEEKRLRRAAQVLQQRLVLRQWLSTHKLQHTYSKLLSLDVSSLEDVYWLEDSTARHVLDPKDFGAWSAARQSLPTGKEALQTLKADLWNAVVKNSKHQDAWTWGGMLVVSVSVCGLVTLAAMTQPSLAPEAKHSLLQYVTGKYLHPPSCKVEWGWTEPQAVGETMCFTVHCFQRNGHPYPICDTDELTVSITHGTRKVTAVIELGSGDPAQANTARVKFTVRTAGVYVISVMIGLVSVSGSPYRKWFTAGRVEARRSRVGRALHALVCAAGHARALHVHPRDQYDNPAPLPDTEPPKVTAIPTALHALHVHPRDQYDNPAPLPDTEPPKVTAIPTALHALHVHPRDQYDNPAPLPDTEPPKVTAIPTALHALHVHPRDQYDNPAPLPDTEPPKVTAIPTALHALHVHPRDQYDNPAPLPDTEPPKVTAIPTALHALHVHPRDQYDNPAPLPDTEPPKVTAIPTALHALHVHPRDQYDNPAPLPDTEPPKVTAIPTALHALHVHPRDQYDNPAPLPDTEPPKVTAIPTALHALHVHPRDQYDNPAPLPDTEPPKVTAIPTALHALHVHPRDQYDNPAPLPDTEPPKVTAIPTALHALHVHPRDQYDNPAPLPDTEPPKVTAIPTALHALHVHPRDQYDNPAPLPDTEPPKVTAIPTALHALHVHPRDQYDNPAPLPDTEPPKVTAIPTALHALHVHPRDQYDNPAPLPDTEPPKVTAIPTALHALHVHPRDQYDNPAPLPDTEPPKVTAIPTALHALHVHPRDQYDNPAPLPDTEPPKVTAIPTALHALHVHPRDQYDNPAPLPDTEPPKVTAIPTALHALHVHPRDQYDNPAPLPDTEPPKVTAIPTALHALHVHPRDQYDNPAPLPDTEPPKVTAIPTALHALHVHPRDQYDNPAPLPDTEPPKVTAIPTALHALHVHPRDQYDNPAPLPDTEPPKVTAIPTALHALHVHPRDQYDNPAPLPDTEPPKVTAIPTALHALHVHPRDQYDNPAPLPDTEPPKVTAIPTALHALHVHPRDQYDNPAPLPDTEPPKVTAIPTALHALHVHPRDQYDNPAPLPDTEPPKGFSIKISPLGGSEDEELSRSATFAYDGVNQRVSVALCFPRAGVYRARLLYEGVMLLNGEFDCIVLTASDTATVQRNMSSKRHNICYEARLVSGKPRRVLCCISPKQLTIKDYILKFIPKRITSFRLCPSTKLILKPTPEGSGPGGEFTLEDGVQPQLELVSPERDLIAATFTQLLLANCGGEDTFKNKQDFFYSEIRKAHARHPHEKLAIRVLRAELLRTSLKATRHFTVQDWCKNFDVTFQGEQGVDWGGVRREWFSLLCGQLFDSKFGLFVSFHDSPTGLVHPNPDRPPHLKLKHFEFAGKLVGKCLYESALGGSYRQLVRARLTRSFLAQIIGLRVHYKVLYTRRWAARTASSCAPASRAPSSRRSSACACTTRYCTLGAGRLVPPARARPPHALLPRADHRPARALQGTVHSALGGSYRQLVRARLTRSFLAQIIGLRVHYKVLYTRRWAARTASSCAPASRAPSSRRSSACACTTRYCTLGAGRLVPPARARPPHALLPRADHRPARALQGTVHSALGGSYRQLVRARLTRSFLAQIIGLRVHYKVLYTRRWAARTASSCAPASRAPSSRRSSACACTTRYCTLGAGRLVPPARARPPHALLPRADHRPARALQGTVHSALGGSYRQLVRARLTRSFLAQIIGLRVHYKVLYTRRWAARTASSCAPASRAPSSRRSSACACTTRYCTLGAGRLVPPARARPPHALLPRADHRPARALQGTVHSALGGSYRQLVRARLTRSFLAQIIGLRVHYKVLYTRRWAARTASSCAPASRAPSSRRSSACACTTRYCTLGAGRLVPPARARPPHALLPRADHRPARALQGTVHSALGGSYRQLVRARLTRSFLAQIIGLRVHYKVLYTRRWAARTASSCAPASRAPSSRRSSACACTTRYCTLGAGRLVPPARARPPHALLPRADHRPARALQGTVHSALGGSYRQLVRARLTRSFLAQIIGLRVHYKVLYTRRWAARTASSCAPASRAPSSRRSSACACTTRYCTLGAGRLVPPARARPPHALLPRADHRPARALQGTVHSALGGSYRQLVRARLTRSFLAQIIGLRVHYKVLYTRRWAARTASSCAPASRAPSSRRSSACACTTRYCTLGAGRLVPPARARPPHALLPRADHRPARALQGTVHSALGGSYRQLVRARLTRSFLAQIIGLRVHYKVLYTRRWAARTASSCAPASRAPSSRRSSACACTTRYCTLGAGRLVPPARARPPHALLPRADHRPARALQGTVHSALGGSYRQLVRARLTRSFLAQIIGLRVHYKVLYTRRWAARTASSCAPASRAPSSRRSSACACTTRYCTLGAGRLVPPARARPPHALLPRADHRPARALQGTVHSALGGSYRQLVRARLTRSFLAQIIGLRVHYKVLYTRRWAARTASSCAPASRAPSSRRSSACACTTRYCTLGAGRLVPPARARPPHALLPRADHRPARALQGTVHSALGGSYRQLVRARLTRSFLAQIIGLRVHYKVLYTRRWAARTASSCAPASRAPSSRRSSACACTTRYCTLGAGRLVPPARARPPHALLPRADHRPARALQGTVHSALGGSYRQLVRARLTRSFLAQIIGLRVHYKYFEQDDPELYLSKIKYVLETDLDGGESVPELYFADDVYDSSGRLLETHDLVPNGSTIRVRNSSKISYLDALAQWRLAARVRAETDAFLRGLTLLVPDNLLAIFDENELELLVCGTGEVSVADWRAHALVSGSGRDWERVLGWLWAALANFSTEERARLLQFTTGCSQLPPGGFQELNPRFQITAAPNFGALPTAHTCFNQLCLPDYDSYEQLVHALLWAINEGGEGFGMI